MGYAKVGKVDGKLILNPTREEWDNGTLSLLVAGSRDAVLMVEGEANEVSETEMLEGITFAHTNIKEFCKLLDQMTKEVGKKKREFTPATPNATLMTEAFKDFTAEARKVLATNVKQDRSNATNELRKHIKEALKANPAKYALTESSDFGKEAAKVTDEVLYKLMRADILNENKRIAGRGLAVVRPIETETSVLKAVHGSALFTRGETQVLAAVTIGGKEGEQMYDSIHGVGYDKFYLHYAMPPFSVGEAKGYRGVGRREIGHGNLAERALKKAMPSQEVFPYTVREACEVL